MAAPSKPTGRRTAFVVLTVAAVLGVGVYVIVKPASADACGQPFAERIDPNSSQHLLPGATAKYLTDPPTSGAHKPGTYATGVVKTPLDKPVQVALLEQGEVLVQYRDASATTRAKLRALAAHADHVTVAPNESLDSKLVATAWLWKMDCRSFDEKALVDFVDAHQPEQPVSR